MGREITPAEMSKPSPDRNIGNVENGSVQSGEVEDPSEHVTDTIQLNPMNNDAPLNPRTMRELETKREPLKTLAGFFVFFVGGNLNFFLLTLIHDLVPRTPLPDLAFYIIPQQAWAWQASDILAMAVVIVAASTAIFHKYRWIVFRRIFLLAGILYTLRAVCLAVTFLPPSFHNVEEVCKPAANTTDMLVVLDRFWRYSITFGMTSGNGGDGILCGDLMFSGHTMTTTLAYFVVLHYTPKGAWYIRWFVTPVCYTCLVCVVISGGHYTIDMLIAYWLTSHMFWTYHTVFEMEHCERRKSPLRHLWWFYACFWFESNVPGCKLPNIFSWPFSKPEFVFNAVSNLSRKWNQVDQQL